MPKGELLPVRVLIVDDRVGISSFGQIAKVKLELENYLVDHVTTLGEARAKLARSYYDIIVLDVTMQSTKDGIAIVQELRTKGHGEPIVLATGNDHYLQQRIADFGDIFSQGLIVFFNKTAKIPIEEVVRNLATRIDPLKRALRLMSAAGMGDRSLKLIDGTTTTVDDILNSSLGTDALAMALRDGLSALLFEMQTREERKRK